MQPVSMQPRRSRLFDELIRKSWWVILFFLLTVFAYDRAIKQRKSEEILLQKKLINIQLEKEKAFEKQQDLKLQISSQTEPEWIEMTLIKGLGLVPEGQKKYVFKTN